MDAMKKTVLIVEDEKNNVDILCFNLQREGYNTLEAYDGETGLSLAREHKPDLILLDVMLPVLDGWGVLRAIRQDSQTPVIMLTAKGETDDKVTGLKSGADDYITKPFEMREVLARIEAVLRRADRTGNDTPARGLHFDKLTIDMDAFELLVDGKKMLTQVQKDYLDSLTTNNLYILGGTGAVEAIISILSMQHGVVTPTINHEEGDEDPNIDYKLNFTFNQAQQREIQYAMSNNFGFGGHNACLLFKRI